jgi:hypothetical protein
MSTSAQINANRENAQKSTGPTSEAGSARSSQNAVRHGLTGQTLVLTPEEAESYSIHVREYMAKYEPADHYQRQLVQDLADSDWGIHQIFLLQSSTISYMQKLSRRLAEAADPEAEAEILANDARAVRKLATLNSYENRKRRASKMLREQIDEISVQETASNLNETNTEPEIGFVNPDAVDPEPPASQPEALRAWLRRKTASMTVDEALKFAKSRR